MFFICFFSDLIVDWVWSAQNKTFVSHALIFCGQLKIRLILSGHKDVQPIFCATKNVELKKKGQFNRVHKLKYSFKIAVFDKIYLFVLLKYSVQAVVQFTRQGRARLFTNSHCSHIFLTGFCDGFFAGFFTGSLRYCPPCYPSWDSLQFHSRSSGAAVARCTCSNSRQIDHYMPSNSSQRCVWSFRCHEFELIVQNTSKFASDASEMIETSQERYRWGKPGKYITALMT